MKPRSQHLRQVLRSGAQPRNGLVDRLRRRVDSHASGVDSAHGRSPATKGRFTRVRGGFGAWSIACDKGWIHTRQGWIRRIRAGLGTGNADRLAFIPQTPHTYTHFYTFGCIPSFSPGVWILGCAFICECAPLAPATPRACTRGLQVEGVTPGSLHVRWGCNTHLHHLAGADGHGLLVGPPRAREAGAEAALDVLLRQALRGQHLLRLPQRLPRRKGPSVDVRGDGVDVRGDGVDARGDVVDVRGDGADVRGYGADVRDCGADVRDCGADLRLPIVIRVGIIRGRRPRPRPLQPRLHPPGRPPGGGPQRLLPTELALVGGLGETRGYLLRERNSA
eukprot:1193362-Prorocentrum_minimum.AAC.1